MPPPLRRWSSSNTATSRVRCRRRRGASPRPSARMPGGAATSTRSIRATPACGSCCPVPSAPRRRTSSACGANRGTTPTRARPTTRPRSPIPPSLPPGSRAVGTNCGSGCVSGTRSRARRCGMPTSATRRWASTCRDCPATRSSRARPAKPRSTRTTPTARPSTWAICCRPTETRSASPAGSPRRPTSIGTRSRSTTSRSRRSRA